MKSASIACLVVAALAAACTSPRHRAPVEEAGAATMPQSGAPVTPMPAAPPPPTSPAEAAPAAAPAPDADRYLVKPGDTLIRIGLDSGQNWRDIARWNGLQEPYTVKVGQTLRIVPPEGEPVAAAAPEAPDARTAAASAGAPVAAPAAVPAPAPATPVASVAGLAWTWPAAGPVLSGFDAAGSKGLSIGGKPGDPILAAADGRVVYAGSGLRGYGNLVIVKHDNTYLTAYAHNQALLVKEDQAVRRGQKIAEMGSSDADRVKLHFEIRRQGKPVDPAQFLPAR
jgi:lipoprotein NlpD